ncbi:MAG: MaoC/PaaZ C-terminal domain-containing protein [Pseudomonadota bacterium]
MYFEDFEPGMSWEVGQAHYDRQEMLDFARTYDPEPFHVDEAWSRAGPFGEIIASGLYTLGKCRYLDQRYFATLGARGLVAAGLESLKYQGLAYAGDTITVTKEVMATRVSQSKPDQGLVTFLTRGRNQRNEPLIEFKAVVFYERRPRP